MVDQKVAQRLFVGVGGLAAAAGLAFLAPKTAHAVTAALVEVVNTRSTPVPNQDVDSPDAILTNRRAVPPVPAVPFPRSRQTRSS